MSTFLKVVMGTPWRLMLPGVAKKDGAKVELRQEDNFD